VLGPSPASREHADEAANLIFGRQSLPGAHRQLVGLEHDRDRGGHDRAIQPRFVAEVIVHRGDIRARGLADFAHGDGLKAAICEQHRGRVDEALAGIRGGGVGFWRADLHKTNV
jgi:hypothetical protein